MLSKIDMISDFSQNNIDAVPLSVLEMSNLQMLYLEGNVIEYLPVNLFRTLTKLTWLDLRNNKLKELPSDIANHQSLETLLLENNKLEKLPNELGLVPNLMVLQITGNPLSYPERKIIDQGAVAICEYLRNEYSKEHTPIASISEKSSDESTSLLTESSSNEVLTQKIEGRITKKIPIQELLNKAAASAKIYSSKSPPIIVKSLSEERRVVKPPKENELASEGSSESTETYDNKKGHHIVKYCHKLSVNSHYNSNKYLNRKKSRPNEDRVVDQELKQFWMAKLKEVLDDQEKLLQQERNLQSLNSWRLEKKLEPERKGNHHKIDVPYDTDPEYENMLQREDLYKEVDKVIRKKRRFTNTVDMQKLINEIVSQLKTLGKPPETEETKDNELERAENEIRRIIELHKKVTSLQTKNDITC